MPELHAPAAMLGRDAELTRVDELLVGARAGDGGALVFLGEAGSGKTALLDAARARAQDFLVVSCRGVEWEAELPFSGLHELVRPLEHNLDLLPAPQRASLEGALGLSLGPQPERLHTYAGALSLLIETSRTKPVLIIADDLHWVDDATREVLSFIARRLGGETVALIGASRRASMLAGLNPAEVVVAPLDRRTVGQLAEQRFGRPLPDSAVDELASASAGNPLAVLESVSSFGDRLWLRGSELDEPLPVSALIERGFGDRISVLSDVGRAALEVLAANVDGDADLVRAALVRLDGTTDGLVEAESARVVVVGPTALEFAHPLLRALVHRLTKPDRLRKCHAAFAEVSGPESDVRAWHAANATLGADEAIGNDLSEAAERFLVRGGLVGAAQALTRAAELTRDTNLRASRLLKAGKAAYSAGRQRWAVELLDQAMLSADEASLRAQVEFNGIRIAAVGPNDDLAASALAVGKAAVGINDDVAARALLLSAGQAVMSGRMHLALTALESFDQLRAEVELPMEVRTETDITRGFILILRGVDQAGRGADLLRAACTATLMLEHAGSLGIQSSLIEALVWIEDFDLAQRQADRVLRVLRSGGAVYYLIGALWADAYRRFRIGDWNGATEAFAESARLSDSVDANHQGPHVAATFAILRACRGDDSLRAQVGEWERLAVLEGIDIVAQYGATALGLLELGAGRSSQAIREFERARRNALDAGHIEPCVLSWPADLVDAYLLAGDQATARERLEEFRERALVTKRGWAMASVARLDAAMADDETYEAKFEEALRLFGLTQAPFDRARAQLAYGQRLRRSRRRVEARVQLEAALAEFERLGAAPWAAQARREMGASAPTLRADAGADRDALTPQEAQIAALVADGASNKEVAGAMFLSPKTVETHLSRVYRKLGVSSRVQLALLRERGSLSV